MKMIICSSIIPWSYLSRLSACGYLKVAHEWTRSAMYVCFYAYVRVWECVVCIYNLCVCVCMYVCMYVCAHLQVVHRCIQSAACVCFDVYVRVCMYACRYVRIWKLRTDRLDLQCTFVFMCTYVLKNSIHVHKYVCMCVYKRYSPESLHTYIHTYINTYIHAYIPECLPRESYIHTYIHTCIHAWKSASRIIHTYIYTYMHTYLKVCLENPLFCLDGRFLYMYACMHVSI